MPAGIPRPAATRRAFSAMTKIRAAARSMEPHPFERYPKTLERAKPDYGKNAKHIATTTAFFLPMIGAYLTWPYVTGKYLNGHI